LINMATYSYGGGYSPYYHEYWYPEWAGTTIHRFNQNRLEIGTFDSGGQNQMMQLWGDVDGSYYTADWDYHTVTRRRGQPASTQLWSTNLGVQVGGVAADSRYVYAMASAGSTV